MSTKVFDASSPAAGGEATSAHPQATRGDRCKRPRTARFLIRQAFESLLRWDKSDVLNKERAGLQKGNGDSDLIPERRRLVVCGTTVTNARSRSPTPVLATKAGRTFLRHAKIEQPHSPPAVPFFSTSRSLNISTAARVVSSSSRGPESKGIARRRNSAVNTRFSSAGSASKASSSSLVCLLMLLG